MPKAKTTNEYFKAVDPEKRVILAKLRKIALSVAPNAEEAISYGIPTLKQEGPIVAYSAQKNHCSLHIMNPGLLKEYAKELKKFTTTASTIHFISEKEIPVTIVKQLVKARLEENLSGNNPYKALQKQLKKEGRGIYAKKKTTEKKTAAKKSATKKK